MRASTLQCGIGAETCSRIFGKSVEVGRTSEPVREAPLPSGERGWGEGEEVFASAGPLTPDPSPPRGEGSFAGNHSVLMELAKEPGAGKGPVALGRCAGEVEHLGGLLQAASREEAELDDLGFLRVQGLQTA